MWWVNEIPLLFLPGGVTLTPDCLEDCVLTCYWGCNVQKLHEALQKHVYCFRIKTPQTLEDALYNEYLYKQQHLYPFFELFWQNMLVFLAWGALRLVNALRILAQLVYEQTRWEIFFMQTSHLSTTAATDCFPWHRQSIKKNDKAEKYCQLPEDAQVVDFGPVPRARYPLVALLTLADEEDREIYDIVSNLRVYFRVTVFQVWMFQERGWIKQLHFPIP